MPVQEFTPRNGGADAPDPMALGNALSQLAGNINQVHLQNVISGANDQIQQIKASDAADADKQSQLQNIGQQLAFHLGAYGEPTSAIQALTNTFAPHQQPIQSPFEAFQQGYSDKKQAATDYLNLQKQNQIDLDDAKTDNDSTAGPNTPGNVFKENSAYQRFNDSTESLLKARAGVVTAAAASIEQAKKLYALTNGVTDPTKLNDDNRMQVMEAASSFAKLVSQGQVTDSQLHLAFPQTAGMTMAQASDYIQAQRKNGLAGANVGAFMQQYMQTAQREAGVAQDTVSRAVLNHFARNTSLVKISGDGGDKFKNNLASTLAQATGAPVDPNDLIIDADKGIVTTKDIQQKDNTALFYQDGVQKAYQAINSSQTPLDVKQKAMQNLQAIGIDPNSMNLQQAKTHVSLLSKTGELQRKQ